jgi:hypothetical protein
MSFLIRMAFWFSLVLLFLPIWPSSEGTDSQPVGAINALSAAQQAVGDLAGICERQPEVCKTGMEAAHTIGVRARESARIAYELLDDKLDEEQPAAQTPPESVPPTPTPRPDR